MEAQFGKKAHHFYGPVVSDLKSAGKRSLEWDLNDWNWDGDLFTATHLNSAPSDCRNRQLFPVGSEIPANAGLSNSPSSCSEDNQPVNEKGKRELEKRRRVVVVEDEKLHDEAGSLYLKLGGQVYPITDEDAKCGKKTKVVGISSNHAVCQVEDCRADLTNAKDYHRRHKVCDVHSKASKALVGNVMQRFCQQCSRFHVLQEFDEGKRSCRRRLAGHNKRRRKAHPDNGGNGGSLNDERGSSYLVMTLLRILSNMHSNSSDQTKDQDLLSHLLRNLANVAGTSNRKNTSGLLQGSQGLIEAGTSAGNVEKLTDVITNDHKSAEPSDLPSSCCMRPMGQSGAAPASDLAQKRMFTGDGQGGSLQTQPCSQSTTMLFPSNGSLPPKANEQASTLVRIGMNNIDLNNVYDDSQDDAENLESSNALVNPMKGSLDLSSWAHSDSHKSSPPQMSGNSDSTFTQSPSSSSGEAQSRTDRIVFKLFGKDPNDLPILLRTQILDWLSNSPTEIESYIRPGCILLTIYLRLRKPTWQELYCDLGSSLRRLLDASNESFWTTGWVFARVQHSVAFTYNGQVVLDAPSPLKSHKICRISSIKPIAVSISEKAQFVVKGFNLFRPTTRLLCAFEGKYLVQESCYDLVECADVVNEHDEPQCLSFPCLVPDVIGRGFIEVEDHSLSGSFFPFIVAEPEVSCEICMLEGAIEVGESANDSHSQDEKMEAKNQALEFIHEMGWLLHRSRLKLRLGHLDRKSDCFPFKRWKWLMEFSMEHDWCAVVKKLLGILFDGTVDSGDHTSIELAVLEMGLLHRAVRRNCRPMAELLLRYSPDKGLDEPGSEQKQQAGGDYSGFIFKPDAVGPAGLTPLHVATCTDGAESVLDALTDDPGLVGIEAWKSARDGTGLTPYDYACLRGHYSYIHLVQKRINKRMGIGHVVLDIPAALIDFNTKQKLSDGLKSARVAILQTEKMEPTGLELHCKACEQKLAYKRTRSSLVYRPAMLSLVGIAAVCVCVALLFKSSPEVLDVFQPFRWETLQYGSI
ncbi:SBP domain-containing protein [Cephalotus follicularis]|uniref:SBP domain-containing protein n=1 Tax=Cephalotus follicularis TaxID=3775 RepID=A0A1Q3CRM4_CEPFO|nr:SBP domain-containing protein [Cephalotus follicularis]